MTIFNDSLPTKTNINYILDRVADNFHLNDADLSFIRFLLRNLKQEKIKLNQFIISPSNDYIKRNLSKSISTIQRRIRKLVDKGLIIYKRSPIGRRFVNNKNTYGFDLSPLFYRYNEFLSLTKKANDEYHIAKGNILQNDTQKNEEKTNFQLPLIAKKTTENLSTQSIKMTSMVVKNDHLTYNNNKFKKEIKNKEKIILFMQQIGYKSFYNQSDLFKLIGIDQFNSWNDVLATSKSLLILLQIHEKKINSLFAQYDCFEVFIISFLTAIKYERQQITDVNKFINQFFYHTYIDLHKEIYKYIHKY
ncbi:helix-turn-helix domain-containing protein [Commensalibacter nepenthis]|uniref:Helix-turn-helix domain-containing protein n=1 Tax=Commensalibacter nepenthis TaxID=3043872 RepID=A0ABT6QC23_9PROT|nr:helix-turn-helix domain-containing protein [Commensalibacter sp. TBRC 10068]MDI2113895.1 helix-turn-helix domain-containing protein [Commensalibacter sp. TBRC 10068]